MKKLMLFLCIIVLILPLLGIAACDTSSENGTSSKDKVKLWITLSRNPGDPAVTEFTKEQSPQLTIWARGTNEESIHFKVTMFFNNKQPVFETSVITEGSTNAAAVGGVISQLPPGSYLIKAVSNDTGEQVGSLGFTVTGESLKLPEPSK